MKKKPLLYACLQYTLCLSSFAKFRTCMREEYSVSHFKDTWLPQCKKFCLLSHRHNPLSHCPSLVRLHMCPNNKPIQCQRRAPMHSSPTTSLSASTKLVTSTILDPNHDNHFILIVELGLHYWFLFLLHYYKTLLSYIIGCHKFHIIGKYFLCYWQIEIFFYIIGQIYIFGFIVFYQF